MVSRLTCFPSARRTPPARPLRVAENAQDLEKASAAFRAMTFQAETDARAFASALASLERENKKDRARLEARLTEAHAAQTEVFSTQMHAFAREIDRSERRVAALAAALAEAGEEAEKSAEAREEEAAARLKRSLETQASALKEASAACLLRERIERHARLDEIRTQVNALTETLAARSANARASLEALRLNVAVSSFADAADRGAPVFAEVSLLRDFARRGSSESDAPPDALVAAVARSVPEKNARRGAPTPAALTNRLEDVARAARRLALVPESGGVLTYLVSGLASFVRLRETADGAPESGFGAPASGVEFALARAKRATAEGKWAEAAEALERGVAGSAAERACAGWIEDARDRQRLEMAVAVLRAHAAAETATLA